MNRQEAFRAGFLLSCAEHQTSLDEVPGLIKLAFNPADWLKSLVSPALAVGGAAVKWPLYAGAGALTAGAAAGAIGGAGLASMTEADVDPADVPRQELMAAYRQHAELARRRMATRQYRPNLSKRRSHGD